MLRKSVRGALVVSLLASTACTQPAAEVHLKGQNTYSRNGQGGESSRSFSYYTPSVPSYKKPAPVVQSSGSSSYATQSVASGPTQQTAAVQSIGVSDLAPPAKSGAPVESKPTSSVNPWTQKPRSGDDSAAEKSASKWSATQDKPVAQLDSAVSSTKNANHGKQVHLITEPRDSAYIWPVNSKKIVSGFGPKGSGKANDGINISASEGEPVWAVADGEVIYVNNEMGSYGNIVIIKHANEINTTYAHLNQSTVDKYDRVKQGDIIGYVGTTGNVKKPQLHFAVREGKNPVDPQKYVSRSMAGL